MKKLLSLLIFLLLTGVAYGQKAKKLTKVESANLTQEQRNVRETTRKSKGGKKDLSMKKRVKIDKKQDKKARNIKSPKQKNTRKRPK